MYTGNIGIAQGFDKLPNTIKVNQSVVFGYLLGTVVTKKYLKKI